MRKYLTEDVNLNQGRNFIQKKLDKFDKFTLACQSFVV